MRSMASSVIFRTSALLMVVVPTAAVRRSRLQPLVPIVAESAIATQARVTNRCVLIRTGDATEMPYASGGPNLSYAYPGGMALRTLAPTALAPVR